MWIWLMNNTTVVFLRILVDTISLESIFYHLTIHTLAVHPTWLFVHTRFKHPRIRIARHLRLQNSWITSKFLPWTIKDRRWPTLSALRTLWGSKHWKMEARLGWDQLLIRPFAWHLWEGKVVMIAYIGLASPKCCVLAYFRTCSRMISSEWNSMRAC